MAVFVESPKVARPNVIETCRVPIARVDLEKGFERRVVRGLRVDLCHRIRRQCRIHCG